MVQIVFWELQLHFFLSLSLRPPRVRPCALFGQSARRSRSVINWVFSTHSRMQMDRRTATAKRTATTPPSQVHKRAHTHKHTNTAKQSASHSYWLALYINVYHCCSALKELFKVLIFARLSFIRRRSAFLHHFLTPFLHITLQVIQQSTQQNIHAFLDKQNNRENTQAGKRVGGVDISGFSVLEQWVCRWKRRRFYLLRRSRILWICLKWSVWEETLMCRTTVTWLTEGAKLVLPS